MTSSYYFIIIRKTDIFKIDVEWAVENVPEIHKTKSGLEFFIQPVLSSDPIRYKRDVKVKLNYSIEFVAQSCCFILNISDMENTLGLL